MKNSNCFFENKECEYYPCHKNVAHLNCLFCYCPLYHKKDCIGNPKYVEYNGQRVKDCSECDFPHRPENHAVIMECLYNLPTDNKKKE